jgi:glucosamine-6-phosphate deaminase
VIRGNEGNRLSLHSCQDAGIMNTSEVATAARFTVDSLDVLVYESRALAGRAAAQAVAQSIAARQHAAGSARVVFAAAPSQDEFLARLVADSAVDWTRIVAFHMDEYLGIHADHPASFRRYLQEHLFRLVGLTPSQLRLIPGEQSARPLQTCLEYEDLLKAEPPDIVCAGIGENGHLAFNDPPVADFLDPVLVKVVRLDAACRAQQISDGCFAQVADVPTHAYTMTMPALLAAPILSVVVPGPRKANAVLTTLRGPISETCPASALRRHTGAKLYLDRDAARLVL